jgi:hypothetical protein
LLTTLRRRWTPKHWNWECMWDGRKCGRKAEKSNTFQALEE